jgi:hypothetical protein
VITFRGTWLHRLVAWGALLGLVLGLVWQVGGDDRGLGVEAIEFLAYRLDQGHTFTLEPDEDEVKLVTWLVGPRPWALDPRRTGSYSLELRVRDVDGALVWQDRFWIRARSSWIEDRQGRLREPAWVDEADRAVSDDRLSQIDVSGLVPQGGFLEVLPDHLPAGYEVRLVAFRGGERSAVSQVRWAEGPEDADREKRASRVGPYRFADLPVRWRSNLAAGIWQRLAALPQPGRGDPRTVRVWTTFHRDPFQDASAWGVPIHVGGAAAFNVEGPASLQAAWWSIDGAGPRPVHTWLRMVDDAGEASLRDLGVVDRVGPLVVPARVVSIQLAIDPEADGPRVLRARTRAGSRDRAYGDPPRWVLDEEQGLQRVAPDLRALDLWRVGSELEPLVFRVEPFEEVRVVFRERLPWAPLPAFGAAKAEGSRTKVRVVAEDRYGEVVGRSSAELFPVPTAFERYTQGDDPSTARVAEPIEFYLHAAEKARWVRVDASGIVDVAVRVSEQDAPPYQLERQYDEPPGVAELARYEPYVRNPWRARNPEDVDRLTRQGRAVRVDCQVRLEPLDEPDPGDGLIARDKHTLPRPGAYELVAEPDRDGVGDNLRTRLRRSPSRVRLEADRRLIVQYRVEPGAVGRPITLSIDGVPHEVTPTATGGRWRFEQLDSLVVSVAVDAPGVFLANAPGGKPWGVHRMWRLGPHDGLSIKVPAGAGGLSLYAIGGPDDPPAMLQWSVHQASGEPGLGALLPRSGAGEHDLTQTGEEARALSFRESGLARLDPFHIDFDERLGGQPGRLELKLVGTTRPIWYRLTSTWAQANSGGARHWEVVAP